MYMYRGRGYKKLADRIMEAGKSKTPQSRLADCRSRKADWYSRLSPKEVSNNVLSCSGEADPSVLFRFSTDWKRPTHIMEGNLFYSKSTNLNVNLIQKRNHRNTALIKFLKLRHKKGLLPQKATE
jgi:hypothetical protein